MCVCVHVLKPGTPEIIKTNKKIYHEKYIIRKALWFFTNQIIVTDQPPIISTQHEER